MQNKPLTGKVAMVSGGARGIGRATVIKLAEAGAAVVVNYFNSSDLALSLCSELKAKGFDVSTIQANVADRDSVAEMFEEFAQRHQRLDIIISNAASGVLKPAMKMRAKHWHWCMNTNALALVNLVQCAKPYLQPGARIIALSSLGSQRAIPDYAFIGASKAALESLVRSLTVELAPDNISVNCISAGVVDTDALKHFPNREMLLEESSRRSLVGRELTPADVADSIYLLCLKEADFIRGQTITVDGGYSIIG